MTLEKTVKKYRELFASGPKIITAHTDKGHFYVSPTNPEPYHSVSYFTSFIKDPSLANWKMNRALDFIGNRWTPGTSYEIAAINQIIEHASIAPEGEFKDAGSIGTQTHAWRQTFFQWWINSGKANLSDKLIDDIPLPDNCDPEVISGCRAIKRFLKETGAVPVACELPLVDDELKVGGTIDDLMVFPNEQKFYYTSKTVITEDDLQPGKVIPIDPLEGGYKTSFKPYLGFVDLKTSSQGKKPAYAFQVRGFYQRMIWKTFHVKPKKTAILHTSKADGTYKLHDLTSMKFLEKDCADLVRLSRSWDKVLQEFKPKQIII